MNDTIQTLTSDETQQSQRRTANKSHRLVGMVPADDIESYDSVPWYRKQSFALFPLFSVALVFIAATGDVYTEANKTMKTHSEANVWRYTPAVRALLVAMALFITIAEITILWALVTS